MSVEAERPVVVEVAANEYEPVVAELYRQSDDRTAADAKRRAARGARAQLVRAYAAAPTGSRVVRVHPVSEPVRDALVAAVESVQWPGGDAA